jgi:hypothetical protein
MTPAQHPVKINQWYGPQPTELQRLLLAACIEPQATALSAWHQWIQQCRFDHEDSASMELASLAVSRLAANLTDGSEVQRCKGWRRREWLVSELALDALRRIEHECRNRSLTAIAIGDVATTRTAVKFASQPFAIRSLELIVPGISKKDRIALDQAARSGPAGDAFQSGSLKLSISPRKLWKGEISFSPQHKLGLPTCPTAGIVIPSIPEQIALLATSNWQRRQYGSLRWILEILSLVEAFADTSNLAKSLTDIALRDGTTATLQAALKCIATLPGTNAIEPLAASVNAIRKSPMSSLRCWRKTTRLEPGWSQFKYFVKRQLLQPDSYLGSKKA